MKAALACAAAVLLVGCTTLPTLRSFFSPTQHSVVRRENWRTVITCQSDGNGSWHIECVPGAGER